MRDQSGLAMGTRILIFEYYFGKACFLFQFRLRKTVAQFEADVEIGLEKLCWIRR